MSAPVIHPAVIIGNGPSRKEMDLPKIKSKFITFGCNMIVNDFHPDYVIAIDRPMIEALWQSEFPNHRILTPPEAERYEPDLLHPGIKVRSNSGMNASMEAIKRGFKHLYLIGFDFILDDKVGNIYSEHDLYRNPLLPQEAIGRLAFFQWLARNTIDIWYTFVVPDDAVRDTGIEFSENVDVITYSTFEGVKGGKR